MENIIKKFFNDRNLKKSTKKLYTHALKDYSNFHRKSLKYLLNEAEEEEDKNIRLKNRKIKKRLEDYRNHKLNDGSAINTAEKYFKMVRTFFKHHNIIIPNLSQIKYPTIIHERFEDIPKKIHIRIAIKSTNSLIEKAIILFMASSGTARNETLNLKVKDFVEATKEYHNEKKIKDILDELSQKTNIIGLFKIIRLKTNYPYYTCCSNEAIDMIIKYLKTRKNLNMNSQLFEINKSQLNYFFSKINKINNWEKVGYFGFFRSHTLRKFHASAIENQSLANALQGRKRDKTTESYFKYNPKRIKERYLKIVDKLIIFEEDKEKELKRINNELKYLKNKITTNKTDIFCFFKPN
jgi:hypothetical protein